VKNRTKTDTIMIKEITKLVSIDLSVLILLTLLFVIRPTMIGEATPDRLLEKFIIPIRVPK